MSTCAPRPAWPRCLRDGVRLADWTRSFRPSWSCGRPASRRPSFCRDLAGLETNRINQLVVLPTLQTTRDENIFAIGDCAACPWLGQGRRAGAAARAVRAPAGVAHGQADRAPPAQTSLSCRGAIATSVRSCRSASTQTVGNLMGGLGGRQFWIEGWFARMMYLSLYKMHELALHGFWKVTLDTAARIITRRTEPHVKLH